LSLGVGAKTTETRQHTFGDGFTIRYDPLKDGNCQFHALSDQLRLVGIDISHTELRRKVTNHLQEHPYTSDGTFIQEFLNSSLDDYVCRMSRDGCFGDNITLKAVSELYDIQILVLSSNPVFVPTLVASVRSSSSVLLLGHIPEGEGDHYVSLQSEAVENIKRAIDTCKHFVHGVSNLGENVTEAPSRCDREVVVHEAVEAGMSSCVYPLTEMPGDSTVLEQSNSVCSNTDAEHSTQTETTITDLGTVATGPAQPILTQYPRTKFGNNSRSFSSHWYTSHRFIEYSVSKDAVFCYPCRVFHCGSSYRDGAFTVEGVRDWKNLAKKLQKHIASQFHGDCFCKWEAYEQSSKAGSVVSQLSAENKKKISENRDYAKKVTRLIIFLGRQGLALRGHDESTESTNRGNFLELCSLFGEYDSKFAQKHTEYFNLTSPSIQNDLIMIAAQHVQRKIVEEVQEAGFICLLADEARSFKSEQLALCVRYTTPSLSVRGNYMQITVIKLHCQLVVKCPIVILIA